MKFNRRNQISYTLLRVVGKIFEIDKRTSAYGTDTQLFDAEIHMIKSIRENEGIHVTGLADMLGVTKGAVSQIIRKLDKKGMITKGVDPQNLSRLILRLTPKGEIAYNHHEKLHEEFERLVDSSLVGASEENKVFLKNFLDTLEEKIERYGKQS